MTARPGENQFSDPHEREQFVLTFLLLDGAIEGYGVGDVLYNGDLQEGEYWIISDMMQLERLFLHIYYQRMKIDVDEDDWEDVPIFPRRVDLWASGRIN